MPQASDGWTRGFNEGADARFRGEPLSANPYYGVNLEAVRAWAAGWRDMNDWWGAKAPRNRQPAPLVPVRCPL